MARLDGRQRASAIPSWDRDQRPTGELLELAQERHGAGFAGDPDASSRAGSGHHARDTPSGPTRLASACRRRARATWYGIPSACHAARRPPTGRA